MEKYEMFFYKYIEIEKYSEEKQTEINDYINGKIDNIKLEEKINPPLGYVATCNDIYNKIFYENDEKAKRMLALLIQIYPERTNLNFSYNRPEIYKVYYNSNINIEFVLFSICKSIIGDFLKYNDYLFFRLKSWANNIEKNENIEWKCMFEYYGNEIEKFILDSNKSDIDSISAKSMLAFLSFFKYKDNPEKKKLYLNIVENYIYSCARKIFTKEEINKVYMQYFKYIKSQKSFNKYNELNYRYNNNMILTICLYLYDESELIDDILKIFIVKADFKNYIKEFRLNDLEEAVRFFRRYNFSYLFDIKLYSGIILNEGFLKDCSLYIEKIENILNNNKDLLELYINKKNEKNLLYEKMNYTLDLDYIVVIAILLKNNTKSAENNISICNYIMMKYLKHIEEKNIHNNQSINIKYNEKDINAFEFIKEKNIDIDNVYVKGSKYLRDINYVIVSAAILYSYSYIARNIINIFMGHNFWFERTDRDTISIFINSCKNLKQYNNENKFEILASYTNVKYVIKSYILYSNSRTKYEDDFRQFIKNHKDEAVYMLLNDMKFTYEVRFYIDILYSQDIGFDYKYIADVFENKLKGIVNFIERFIIDKEEKMRKYIEPLLDSKYKNTREAVKRVIKIWDSDKIEQEIKNIKDIYELTEYVQKNYDKSNNKAIPFYDKVNFDNIRIKDSEQKADSILIKYYISEYMILNRLHIVNICSKISEFLNQDDLKNVIFEIYNLWVENGADTKKKNILFLYVINCNDLEITSLKKQIDFWAEHSRGALASFAVEMMVFHKSDITLLIIDSISNKYKNKQVKNAAIYAMKNIADSFGITKEELADKIIPNLGFDKKRKKEFDYGSRKFYAYLNNKLEITLFNEDNKIIKSLPKANLNDDIKLAQDSKEEFKILKKQLKTIISTQKNRLEIALITGRKWTSQKWIELFVENPIMNGFATGLIWEEVDNDNNIINTFRYMEDGSFNTFDEEEYFINDNSSIMLLYPIDVDENIISAWKQQLEDYEIIQPFNQINIPVYHLTEEEENLSQIIRFSGKDVYFGTVKGIMEKYNFRKTSVIDGGGYEGYYYESKESNIGIQIKFEYLYISMPVDEKVKIRDIEFYKAGDISYESYSYDEIMDKNRIMPKDVSKKMLSFALMVCDLIAQKEIK